MRDTRSRVTQLPHPALAPLEFLIGVWRGSGRGCYPTIDPFEYVEEATFAPGPGKPFLAYRQKTRRAGGDRAVLHSEVGYLRPADGEMAELVIAQPTGIVEVHDGTVQGTRLEFRSSAVGLSETAVDVTQVRRMIEVSGNTMIYRLFMSAVGKPMQIHLEAELERSTG